MPELFPHDLIRPLQKKMMDDISQVLSRGQNLLCHAPTGLGKTAATLSVCVPFALDHGLKVFFLTNRHTQHYIAIETLKKIKQKHGTLFFASDIIGKKWMCAHENVHQLRSSEFVDYCKAMRENDKCSFYKRLYKKGNELSVLSKKAMADAKNFGALHVEDTKNLCSEHGLCPYYFTTEISKDADVIVADYYNVFNPIVQQNFFRRIGAELEKSIIIVDEGHNLPERIRSLMSSKLSSYMIKSAVYEAKKFGFKHVIPWLQEIQHALSSLSKKGKEDYVKRTDFMNPVAQLMGYDNLISELKYAGEEIREKNKRSFIGSIADFLEKWKEEQDSFIRYTNEKSYPEPIITLHHSCLDPSLLTGPVFDKIHSGIVMSGTLIPPSMFKDLLGVSSGVERIYGNPFPKKNRLALVVPKTTTKYSSRSTEMYQKIGNVCADIINAVPGNSAFFFPSYHLRDSVTSFAQQKSNKVIFVEKAGASSDQKALFLEDFKARKKSGAALFGVAAANFSEGVDLPGDYLKAVVIVGLPLARPDIQTKSLISYYEKKFHRGWDYGYTYPAMIKCLQAAGRCIRTEKDRGVIIFLDERFIQTNYYQSIPKDWDAEVTREYVGRITDFFQNR